MEKEIEKVSYKSLLANRDFFKYALSKAISRFGDSLDMIAYGMMVYKLTGSATILALIFAVNGLPSVLLNMVSGTLINYLPLKKLIVFCDFLRGAIVCFTVFLFYTGQLMVWHLFLFTFINSSIEAFRTPSDALLLTKIIDKDEMDHGVSFDSSLTTFSELIGFSIAGFLILAIGISGVILIDGLSFFIAGLFILTIKHKDKKVKKEEIHKEALISDFKEGVKFVRKDKLILHICIFAGFFNMFLIPFNALQVVYVTDVLEKGPEALSVMASSFMIAMIAGSILVPAVKEKISGYKLFISSGFVIALSYMGLSILGTVSSSVLIYLLLIVICACFGLSVAMLSIPLRIALMTKVEGEFIPRIISLVNMLALSSAPLGGLLLGIMISYFSLQSIYIFVSIGVALLFAFQMLSGRLKEL